VTLDLASSSTPLKAKPAENRDAVFRKSLLVAIVLSVLKLTHSFPPPAEDTPPPAKRESFGELQILQVYPANLQIIL
jgi:hypothetical protein